jgi:hypothetical protein
MHALYTDIRGISSQIGQFSASCFSEEEEEEEGLQSAVTPVFGTAV